MQVNQPVQFGLFGWGRRKGKGQQPEPQPEFSDEQLKPYFDRMPDGRYLVLVPMDPNLRMGDAGEFGRAVCRSEAEARRRAAEFLTEAWRRQQGR